MLSDKTLILSQLVGITATLATVSLTLTPVQAQTLTLSVNGSIDSGTLDNTTYTGTITFPEPASDFTGFKPVSPLHITFSLPPDTLIVTEANANPPGPEVQYENGDLLGLSFSVDNAQLGTVVFDFAFVPGFTDVGEASLTYDVENGVGGSGSAEFEIVPEPTTMLASFGVLGLLGHYRRRYKKTIK